VRAIRRSSHRDVQYVSAIEFMGGAVHLHAVIVHGGLPTDALARDFRRCFGGCHVRVNVIGGSAEDHGRVAAYLSKDLGSTASQLRRGGGSRVTPITFSRGWPSVPWTEGDR